MEHSMHFCCSFTSRVWLCDPWTTAPRLPCPSLSPRVCSNSCPLSWCHLTIIICRSLLLMSSIFPSIQVFSNDSALCIRWPKYWNSSFRISPSRTGIQDWFPLGLTGLILLSKRLSRVFFSTIIWKNQFFSAQPSLWSNSHICIWLLQKP